MNDFTIDELVVPAALDADGADDFVAANDVRNRVEADALGMRDLWADAADILPTWNNPYEPKRLLVARVDGRIVARAIYETRLDASSTTCWFTVEVLREHRRSGIEDALHDELLSIAHAENRATINFYTMQRETGSTDRIASPTGYGSVPADEETVIFLTANGYRLGQVARISRLPLPVSPGVLDDHIAVASAAAGHDYRIVNWTGRTPDEWLSGIAELNTRMSTDAPTGEMAEDEDPWDDDRVRVDDDRADASPRELLVAGVVHVPSGRLVGFNELSVSPDPAVPVEQQDTLVLAEHRGHRLGMLLKVANLAELHRVAPGRPSVITFNAEENRHMLSVNEAVGFVPIGYEAGWVREL